MKKTRFVSDDVVEDEDDIEENESSDYEDDIVNVQLKFSLAIGKRSKDLIQNQCLSKKRRQLTTRKMMMKKLNQKV